MSPSMQQRGREEGYHVQQLLEVILPGIKPECVVTSCVGGALIKYKKTPIAALNATQYGHLYAKGYLELGIWHHATEILAGHNEHKFTEKGLAIIRGEMSI